MEQSSIRLVLRSADVTVADFVQTLLKPQTCIDVTVRVKLQRGSKAGNVWVTLDSHWESNTNGGRDHPQIRSMNLKMCCKAVRQSKDCEKRMLCVRTAILHVGFSSDCCDGSPFASSLGRDQTRPLSPPRETC